MTKCYCDRCGKEVSMQDGWHLTVAPKFDELHVIGRQATDKDLCLKCARLLTRWLDALETAHPLGTLGHLRLQTVDADPTMLMYVRAPVGSIDWVVSDVRVDDGHRTNPESDSEPFVELAVEPVV